MYIAFFSNLQKFIQSFVQIYKNVYSILPKQVTRQVMAHNIHYLQCLEDDEEVFGIEEWCVDHTLTYRSSHQRCSVMKRVLRNFIKFTGKHLWKSLYFNKVRPEACNFIKTETPAREFSREFYHISKNTF